MSILVKVDTDNGPVIIDTSVIKAVLPCDNAAYVMMRDTEFMLHGDYKKIVEQLYGGINNR